MLLTDLTLRPFKELPDSRAGAFAEMDLPALQPLPEQHCETPNGRWSASASTTTLPSSATTTRGRASTPGPRWTYA